MTSSNPLSSSSLYAAKPIVAIVGRPNVGKSTLVNRIIGSRKAIVDDQPGVTRDRSYHPAEWCGNDFYLVDTGGLVPESEQFFEALINQQVTMALEEAQIIVLVVDGRAGVTAVDEDIAEKLRRTQKTVLLAVNKIDTPELAPNIHEFYSLGLGEPIAVSAVYGYGGVGDLLDKVVETFGGKVSAAPRDLRVPPDDEPLEFDAPEADDNSVWMELDEEAVLAASEKLEDVEPPKPIRIAIVGRPNVGKSSLLNALAGVERAIVSDVAGTTRDAIEAVMEHAGRQFVVVDTAGIRRKSKVDYGVELFSVDRSLRAVTEADVTVMVLDAREGATDQDKRIMELSNQRGSALVVVMNKWDLVPDKNPNSAKEVEEQFRKDAPHASFAPVIFTSAVEKQRILKILEAVICCYDNAQRRVKTSLVNTIITEAFALNPPPIIKNKVFKVLYATQVGVGPPTFILFTNDAKLLRQSYERYLERKLRESFDFAGTPVRLIARTRERVGRS